MTDTLSAQLVDGATASHGVAAEDPSHRVDAYGFSPRMVSVTSPAGVQAEAIRGLRTHIMAQHLNHGRRALAVCAPGVDVGCSFVAANLAVALSQIGVKTLLMDGDLRRPSIERLIRPPRATSGLCDSLRSNNTPFGANIDANVLSNLSIMYAGQAAGNAQELLAGDRFRALMNYCLREFDATIVDTPPANTSSDARRIGALAGYALIVAAQDRTMVKDVRTLIDQLQADHVTVVGTVMNQA